MQPRSAAVHPGSPSIFPFCLSAIAFGLASHAALAAEQSTLETVKVSAEALVLRPAASKLAQEEIARPQAKSLAEVLDALPGVNAGGSPRPGGQTINVWGFGDVEQVQVYLDGAGQGFDKYQQGTSFVDPELLGSVEVIKGGHSPFYGNGAFGGVVKAETKTVNELLLPGRSVGGFAKLGYQDNGHRFSQSLAAYAGGAGQPADILAYVTHSKGGDGTQPDGTPYRFSGGEQQGGMLKLGWRPADGHSLKLGFVRQDDELRTPWAARRGDIPAPSAYDIAKYGLEEAWLRKTVWREQTVESMTADWSYVSSDLPWLDLRLSYAQSRRFQHDTRPDGVNSSAFDSQFGKESWVSQRDKQWELRNVANLGEGWSSQQVTVGVAWSRKDRDAIAYMPSKARDPSYNYGLMNPRYSPPGSETMQSAYWVHEWRPLDGFSLTPSLRYDHIEVRGRQNLAPTYNNPAKGHDYSALAFAGWSPRLAASWRFLPRWTLDAGYAHTWRAPNADEVYDVQTLGSTTASSRQLRPEKLKALKLGLAYDGGGVLAAGDKLSASLAWFRQDVTDAIGQRIGPNRGDAPGAPLPAVIGFYRNLPGYVIRGFEFDSRYQWRGAFASLSLSSVVGERRHSLRDPWGKDEPMVDIPPRKAVLTAGYTFAPAGLTLGAQGKFVRAQDRVPQNVNPEAVGYAYPAQHGYALAGLFAVWQPATAGLKGMEVRLAVDNLFNRSYQPYLTEGAEGMGRAIRSSVSWRF